MQNYEKALILTSTMTEEELLQNEYVTYEVEQQALDDGIITHHELLESIREKLYKHLKAENILRRAVPQKYLGKLEIKATPFYLTDEYATTLQYSRNICKILYALYVTIN